MKLSYESETIKKTTKKLVEYVIGVKPETSVGVVNIDGLFPASQFHFTLNNGQIFTKEQENKIKEEIKLPFCGMVDVNIFGKRIIITTTCSAEEREYWGNIFATKINEVMERK